MCDESAGKETSIFFFLQTKKRSLLQVLADFGRSHFLNSGSAGAGFSGTDGADPGLLLEGEEGEEEEGLAPAASFACGVSQRGTRRARLGLLLLLPLLRVVFSGVGGAATAAAATAACDDDGLLSSSSPPSKVPSSPLSGSSEAAERNDSTEEKEDEREEEVEGAAAPLFFAALLSGVAG